MTVKDLQRLFLTDDNPAITALMKRCKGLSFEEFWSIAPPISNITNQPSDLHDYQVEVINTIQQHKRCAVLKCRSAGLSTLSLYYACWKVLSQQTPGSYLFITGVGYVLSSAMCRAAKEILKRLCSAIHVDFVDKDNSTTITFNNARFSFFGSDSKSYRGQGVGINQQVQLVIADEVGWFDDSDNWEAAISAFSIKSGGSCEMLLITTPSNKLHGLAHQLFSAPTDGLYKRMHIDWQRIENKMVTSEQLNMLRVNSKSWKAEFCLQWGAYYSTGTVYNSAAVDRAIQLGTDYDPEYFELGQGLVSMGCDPGMGSSGSGITILNLPKNSEIVQVLYCDELIGSSYEDLIELARQLIDTYSPSVIFVDAANPEVLTSLKKIVNDPLPFHDQLEWIKRMKPVPELHTLMKCVPIAFNSNGKIMLEFSKFAIEKGEVAIHPSMTKLISSLRTAVENNGLLNKKATSFDNAHDSYLLAMKAFSL